MSKRFIGFDILCVLLNDGRISGYFFDFLSHTEAFASNLNLAHELLSKYQDELHQENAFSISEPSDGVGGWSFATLTVSEDFLEKLIESHNDEIRTTVSEPPKGIYYRTSESVLQFIAWINVKMKEQGFTGEIKMSKKGADLGYGAALSVSPVFLPGSNNNFPGELGGIRRFKFASMTQSSGCYAWRGPSVNCTNGLALG